MVTLTVSSFHDRPPDIFYSNAHRTFVSPLHQFQQACALCLVHPAKQKVANMNTPHVVLFSVAWQRE